MTNPGSRPSLCKLVYGHLRMELRGSWILFILLLLGKEVDPTSGNTKEERFRFQGVLSNFFTQDFVLLTESLELDKTESSARLLSKIFNVQAAINFYKYPNIEDCPRKLRDIMTKVCPEAAKKLEPYLDAYAMYMTIVTNEELLQAFWSRKCNRLRGKIRQECEQRLLGALPPASSTINFKKLVLGTWNCYLEGREEHRNLTLR